MSHFKVKRFCFRLNSMRGKLHYSKSNFLTANFCSLWYPSGFIQNFNHFNLKPKKINKKISRQYFYQCYYQDIYIRDKKLFSVCLWEFPFDRFHFKINSTVILREFSYIRKGAPSHKQIMTSKFKFFDLSKVSNRNEIVFS